MTYAAEHILWTIQGDAYNAVERWENHIRFSFPGTPAQPSLTLLGNLNTEMVNFYAGTAPYTNQGICRFTRYTGCKVSWVGVDGKLKPGSLVQVATNTTPTPGAESGAATAHMFPQNTIAVTFLTAIPRGRASKGRVFPAPVCNILQSSGQISSGIRDLIAAQWALLLTRVNALSEIGSAQVMSREGTGLSANIVNTRVGMVVDTQRRRRRSLVETPFATSAVTP